MTYETFNLRSVPSGQAYLGVDLVSENYDNTVYEKNQRLKAVNYFSKNSIIDVLLGPKCVSLKSIHR